MDGIKLISFRKVFILVLSSLIVSVWGAKGQERQSLLQEYRAESHNQELSLQFALLSPAQDQVRQYEKVEIGVRLPEILDSLVKQFTQPPRYVSGLNPYDPKDIDLQAALISPSGVEIRVNGFFYNDFERVECTLRKFPCWINKFTSFTWRIRFSPSEIGEWKVIIRLVSDHLGHSFGCQSEPFSFYCNASDKKGYIVSKSEKLLFSKTGETFVPIGLNTDWYRWGIVNPSISDRYQVYFDSIHSNGGNMASLALINRTGLQFEWEHLGIYENPDALINSYEYNSNRQAHAWEIDRILELAEEKDIYLKFTLLQHADFGKDFWNWPENPYHRYIGNVKEPIDFFKNDSAFQFFRNKLRYIAARWGYSDHIAWYELLTEIDNIKDFSKHQKLVYDWFDTMAGELKVYDSKNHLIAGSYSTFEMDNDSRFWVWRSKNCDLINIHSYGQNKRTNFNRYADLKKLRNQFPSKPVLIGEIASYTDPVVDDATDIQFHNNLWATFFMGNTGSGLAWHWETSIPKGYCMHFKPLYVFSDLIDFKKDWVSRRFPLFNGLTARGKNYRVENFYLLESNKESSVGWIHNATAYWYNKPLGSIINSSGDNVYPHDDDKWTKVLSFPDDFARIAGLKTWKSYCFTPFLIKEDSLIQLSSVSLLSNIAGQIDIPTWKYFYYANDFAYMLVSGKCPCSMDNQKRQRK